MTTLHNEYVTARQALVASKMDFVVKKFPLFTRIQPSLDPKIQDAEIELSVPDRYATVRMDTQAVLGDVGSVYTVVQNVDAFDVIDEVAHQYEVLFNDVFSFDQGARVVVKARLGNEIGISDRDTVIKTLLLSNSHNGTSKINVRFVVTAVDAKTNTKTVLPFELPTMKSELNLRHTTNVADRLNEGKKIMAAAHAAFDEVVKIFEQMLQKGIDIEFARLFVTSLFAPDYQSKALSTRTKNMINEVVSILKKESTLDLWKLYNCIALYLDKKSTMKKADKSVQINSQLFGQANSIKSEAFRKIVKLI